MTKEFVKRVLPAPITAWLIRRKLQIELILAYRYDYKRYYKYSGTNGYTTVSKLQGLIIKTYHIVEKGLTMPEPRLGFGRDKILFLSDCCISFVEKYKLDNQVKHAISVVLEYKKFHEDREYKLDDLVLEKIAKVENIAKVSNVLPSSQIHTTIDEYFQFSESNFALFSNSRKSVRNYSSKEVSLETINKIVELALNTPSACNRQTVRVYVYTNKQQMDHIFSIQKGSRGFGHLASKLIVVTVEVAAFAFPMERNQAYVDGGMYAMNLLYSLHYHNVAACILSCSNTPKVDKEMRKACGIKDSELFIAMISCGIPPSEFSIATSFRFGAEDMCTVQN